MRPDINLLGNACIFLSLASCLIGIASVIRCQVRSTEPGTLWLTAAVFNFFAMTIASLAMVTALLTNDFSVSYVSHVGAKETPRFFAAISLWSSLEGSILLWGLILSGYTALCLFCYRNKFSHLMPWVAITLLSISAFFYLVLALPANPFQTVFPIPDNGPGPNPLLQNHWLMALHPPLLYLGYVGMSVPFAFATASMIAGDLSSAWVDITRKWMLTAWMFLSIAIIFGGWWSYAVLGWGGYWAWDPVENASFMPWLTATPLLHSIMVQQRRGMLKIWNLSLIVTTFLLTLLGTFLTRSGVLDSVHSFTESGIGHYFLAAIGVTLIVSAALLVWKAPRFSSPGKLDSPFCRETTFLFANLLFVSFCFVVLLGTLYPLISEAIRDVKVTVGEPFFNQMSIPLALAIILLMGIGMALPWGKGDGPTFFKILRLPFVLAILTTLWAYAIHIRKIGVLITIGFTAFSLAIILLEFIKVGLEKKSLTGIFYKNPRRYGGFLAHIGIIIVVAGVALSANYKSETQVTLKPGENFHLGPYQMELVKLYAKEKPQRFEVIAMMGISQNGKPIGFLEPKLNFYPTSREPVGSPAIRSTFMDDLYLTLMAFDPKVQEVSLRAFVTPAVSWIWSGGGFIVLGALISLGFKRKIDKSHL